MPWPREGVRADLERRGGSLGTTGGSPGITENHWPWEKEGMMPCFRSVSHQGGGRAALGKGPVVLLAGMAPCKAHKQDTLGACLGSVLPWFGRRQP